jgi:hypothetical protein
MVKMLVRVLLYVLFTASAIPSSDFVLTIIVGYCHGGGTGESAFLDQGPAGAALEDTGFRCTHSS